MTDQKPSSDEESPDDVTASKERLPKREVERIQAAQRLAAAQEAKASQRGTEQRPAQEAQGQQQGLGRPQSTPEIVHELHARVAHLEAAFHASLSHLGAGHPEVVAWAERAKARIVAFLHGGQQPPSA